MDATITRRTKDQARQGWYAQERRIRFARFLNFGPKGARTAHSEVPAQRISVALAEACDSQPRRDRLHSFKARTVNHFEALLKSASGGGDLAFR
ncbi:hypothetical protein [Singulisphaera sp. PoT]|uniref:hypothetical protein n=1 Tax=Singulisphaera sp. PoT TaxID=3411797 RepID=UPI003BF4B41F